MSLDANDPTRRTPTPDPSFDEIVRHELPGGRAGRVLLGLIERHGGCCVALTSIVLIVAIGLVGLLVLFDEVAPSVPDDDLLIVRFGVIVALPLLLTLPILGFSFRLLENLLDTKRRLLVEIERRLQAEKRLRRLATTDDLTGLDNRRQFFARGREAVALARRYGHDVALLAIDIDQFKAINDRFGHKRGDGVLLRLADVLRGALRSTDVPARFGGDEFMVLMPQTGAGAALVAAERIRAAFEESAGSNPTISVGIASAQGADAHVEELIAQADTALYAAKQAGRNRVQGSDQHLAFLEQERRLHRA